MTPLHDDRSGFEKGMSELFRSSANFGRRKLTWVWRPGRSLRRGWEALPDEHALMILAHFMRFCSQGQPVADEF